jgi:hypothetical protein
VISGRVYPQLLRISRDSCIDADPARAPEIRGRRGAAIAARKRALSEWDKRPDAVHDPELFRREILPRLATVKLMDIAEAAGCCKASASDIRRGKWTPHVSTWSALAELVGKLFDRGTRQLTGSAREHL